MSLQGSITYTFPCDRWLARDEEDKALERELVAAKVTEETVGKDGKVKQKDKKMKEQLVSKCHYYRSTKVSFYSSSGVFGTFHYHFTFHS